VRGPGNYGVSLFRNQVINIDIRPKTYTEQFKILAQDDLNIAFRFHAVIRIEPGTIEDVVLKYGGKDAYVRYLKEPFRTFVRDAVQKHASREVKTKRDAIAEEVRARLLAHLEATPFELVSLVVGNIDYPPIVAQAVEKKLAAKQLLEEKETQKEIAQRDAEIRVEEAKGIAEAQKIINATLTPNYLQHEAIQAQLSMAESPNHTTVYIPVGTNGIPLVYAPK
jgi:regulator of protease activity HflC (stomatin/prohibitin superfamily)